jgi:hypothetical protein
MDRKAYEQKMRKIANSGVLEQYEHPKDSRVITIPPSVSVDFFEAAAFSKKYQAAIRQRPEEFKTYMRSNFKALEKAFKHPMVYGLIKFNEGGESKIQPPFDLISEELKSTSSLFNRMSGFESFSTLIHGNFKTTPEKHHAHERVINSTWLNNGTLLSNKKIQVAEGDILYIADQFPHESPEEKRITLINFRL